MVLGSLASFFVFLGKKAASAANEQPGVNSTAQTEPTQNS